MSRALSLLPIRLLFTNQVIQFPNQRFRNLRNNVLRLPHMVYFRLGNGGRRLLLHSKQCLLVSCGAASAYPVNDKGLIGYAERSFQDSAVAWGRPTTIVK